MRYLLLVLILCGCVPNNSKKEESLGMKFETETIEKPEKPEVPKQIPTIPVNPTKTFLVGYKDGYFGTWLAPGRWIATNDYRNGWSLGAYDRKHNLPYRFNNDL